MDFDLEDLKRMAGVYDTVDSFTVEQPINPRKLLQLKESIRRGTYNEALDKIYNWVQAKNIDPSEFKELLSVAEMPVTFEEDDES